MIVRTRIFEFYHRNYQNLSELAQIMGISVSQIYRVRESKRSINQKFIVGAMKAFPGYKFEELFYLSPELPTVTSNYRYQAPASEPVAKGKQKIMETQPALEKFTSATEVYAQHLQSHTSALISLTEAAQELKNSTEKLNKVLSYLTDVHSFSVN